MAPVVDPVAIGFAAALVMAFTVGITVTVYHAWVKPAIARQRLRRQLRKNTNKHAPSSPASPYIAHGELRTPDPSSPTKDSEKGESIFVKEAEACDDPLPLPKPVFSFMRKDRFSTSTQDGVWWMV